MNASEIKVGETYMVVATLSDQRKHLEGLPFEVVEIREVWRGRKWGRAKKHKVKRFFNEDGIGARPEELEPLNDESPF
jgi:hypothetical protein